MLRVEQIVGLKVYKTKTTRKGEVKHPKVGKVHMAVFSPDGRNVMGFTVKRPDVAGMVARPDIFMARDGFTTFDRGLLLKDEEGATEDAARERLGIDWDRCIMWTGMDAKTEDGKVLGYVDDAEYDPRTGDVTKFCIGDGAIAESLVGSLEIPAGMLRGYSKGFMVVDPAASKLELSGGAAAAAGEGYAKAKVKGKAAAEKAGAAASTAIDKGSYALGRALGKAKRAIDDAREDDADEGEERPSATEAADVRVTAPKEPEKLPGGVDERTGGPQTYVPVSEAGGAPFVTRDAGTNASGKAGGASTAKKTGAKTGASKTAGEKPTSGKGASSKKDAARERQRKDAERAVGRQLGKMGSMFGSFVDEYKKASK